MSGQKGKRMTSELSFNNKIFEAARVELDIALQDTVKEMLFREKTQCSIGLKIKIEIQNHTLDGDVFPIISYKLSASIPDKFQSAGNLHGDCVLRVDENGGILMNTMREQTSMPDPPKK